MFFGTFFYHIPKGKKGTLIDASATGIPWLNCLQFVPPLLALSSAILVFLLNAFPPYNGLAEGGGRGHTLPPLYFKVCLSIRTDLTSSCTYTVLICQ